jgi:hypothetical protein
VERSAAQALERAGSAGAAACRPGEPRPQLAEGVRELAQRRSGARSGRKAGASACPAADRGGAKRRSSYATCRTTVCREVTRGAGGAAVRRLREVSHGSSEATRGGRRRPSRRRQRKARP